MWHLQVWSANHSIFQNISLYNVSSHAIYSGIDCTLLSDSPAHGVIKDVVE